MAGHNPHTEPRESGVRPGDGALSVRLKDTIEDVKFLHVVYLLLGFYPHLPFTDGPEVRTRHSHKQLVRANSGPEAGRYLST